MAVKAKSTGISDRESLIFIPKGGSGEFSAFAEKLRAAAPVPSRSLIVPIQHTHVEWSGISATHIGLEALSARGHFLPLALIPLLPFITEQPTFTEGFRHQPLFRLAWYGVPSPDYDTVRQSDDKCDYHDGD